MTNDEQNIDELAEDIDDIEDDEADDEVGENETLAENNLSEIKGKRRSPMKAIRLKCIDCSGGSWHEVALCEITGCSLHPFRFGKNPFRTKRVMSEEQKRIMGERLQAARKTQSENSENQSENSE